MFTLSFVFHSPPVNLFFLCYTCFVWHCRFPIEENCRIILNLLCAVSIASNGYIYVRIIFKTEKNKLKASCFCSVSGAFIERLSFLMSVTRTKVDLTSPCFRPNYQLNFSSLINPLLVVIAKISLIIFQVDRATESKFNNELNATIRTRKKVTNWVILSQSARSSHFLIADIM